MKQLIPLATAAMLFAACSENRPSDRYQRDEPRSSMRRVERNAGEIVGEANKGIQRGVDAVDRSWNTPAERDRENRDRYDSNERTDANR